MGSPGRTSLARILLLAMVLAGVPAAAAAAGPAPAAASSGRAPAAAPAGAVDSRAHPSPLSATLPEGAPTAAGRVRARATNGPDESVSRAGRFVPGRVLVRFAAGAGEGDSG
jgi:hypothetical protein